MSDTTTILGIVSGKVVAAAVVGSLIGGILWKGSPIERTAVGAGGFLSAITLHPLVGKIIGASLDVILPDKWMPSEIDLHVAGGFLIGMVGMIACASVVSAARHASERVEDIVDQRLDDISNDKPNGAL